MEGRRTLFDGDAESLHVGSAGGATNVSSREAEGHFSARGNRSLVCNFGDRKSPSDSPFSGVLGKSVTVKVLQCLRRELLIVF